MLRLANIRGDAPRKMGSCVIHLKGPHAGDWFDFDGNVGGGPLSTVSEGSQARRPSLSGIGVASSPATRPGLATHPRRRQRRTRKAPEGAAEREISFILSRALPLAGTHAEAYLQGRGLDTAGAQDLLFHPDLAHFQTRAGYPALVAIVRDQAGEPVGVHRIWLDPAAPAKAALDNPKKSVGSIRGGAIRLFPATTFVVLTEGIETALAIRTARPDLPVWAAIAAGHLAECQLPADLREILIAADHDANGAGLKAAERLAERLVAEGRRVWIALPPNVDTDFADLLATEGASAARTILSAATEFLPVSPVLSASIIDTPAQCSIEDTKKLYPLPRLENLSLEYRRASEGSVRLYKHAGKDKRGQDRWEMVATPFGPVARLRYMDHDEAFGLRVHVEAMDARVRAVDFDRASLARVGASEIKGALFAAGLRTESDGDSLAVQILKAADPDDEILVVSRPGWHRVEREDYPLFVTPGGASISEDDARLELATAARFGTVSRGSLDGWKSAVAAAADAKGCPHFLLGVLAGFAGAVQSLAGLDSCGINLSGLSSSGKTTAQRLAVSAWTSPSIGAGLLQSMRSTENAVEVFAQAASGTVLALDELAHADGRAVARLIYAIAGGQGKARLTAGALLKQRYAWSTYAVLSSECSTAQIQIHYRIPMLFRDIHQVGKRADTRIVDEDVESTKTRDRGVDHLLATCHGTEVAGRGDQALATQLTDCSIDRLGFAAVDSDRCSQFEEQLRRAVADTHGAASDQHAFALEFHHQTPPQRRPETENFHDRSGIPKSARMHCRQYCRTICACATVCTEACAALRFSSEASGGHRGRRYNAVRQAQRSWPGRHRARSHSPSARRCGHRHRAHPGRLGR